MTSMKQGEHVESLRAILRKFLAEDILSLRRWEGAEAGKAWIGNGILGAMENIGLDRKKELEEAMADAKRSLEHTPHSRQRDRVQPGGTPPGPTPTVHVTSDSSKGGR